MFSCSLGQRWRLKHKTQRLETGWDVRRSRAAPGAVCLRSRPSRRCRSYSGPRRLSPAETVLLLFQLRPDHLSPTPPPCSDSIISVGPLSWHMTKRGGRGPDRSCSFAVYFVHHAVCVLPPDISTHLAAEPYFSNLLFFLSVFQFSPCRTPSQPSHLEFPPASTPPFLPTKPAPSLHLIPPLRFITPPPHLHHPLFFWPSLLPASLKDFFASSALCLSKSRSVMVWGGGRWQKQYFRGAGTYKIGWACLFSEKKVFKTWRRQTKGYFYL